MFCDRREFNTVDAAWWDHIGPDPNWLH